MLALCRAAICVASRGHSCISRVRHARSSRCRIALAGRFHRASACNPHCSLAFLHVTGCAAARPLERRGAVLQLNLVAAFFPSRRAIAASNTMRRASSARGSARLLGSAKAESWPATHGRLSERPKAELRPAHEEAGQRACAHAQGHRLSRRSPGGRIGRRARGPDTDTRPERRIRARERGVGREEGERRSSSA